MEKHCSTLPAAQRLRLALLCGVAILAPVVAQAAAGPLWLGAAVSLACLLGMLWLLHRHGLLGGRWLGLFVLVLAGAALWAGR